MAAFTAPSLQQASARIIIFDEPTSGLDMKHMRQVSRLIRNIAAQGRSIVVITHDPEFAVAACDRNITIEHGKVSDTYDLDEDGAAKLTKTLIG
ncbi:MAG: AAA family ATPase [Bifidobacterium sp.]|uniref:AAA family ATPase n=2 Tax=Bifidobacterium fermentum TaxID=3059035 RepID=A0AB39UL53_9BIFI